MLFIFRILYKYCFTNLYNNPARRVNIKYNLLSYNIIWFKPGVAKHGPQNCRVLSVPMPALRLNEEELCWGWETVPVLGLEAVPVLPLLSAPCTLLLLSQGGGMGLVSSQREVRSYAHTSATPLPCLSSKLQCKQSYQQSRAALGPGWMGGGWGREGERGGRIPDPDAAPLWLEAAHVLQLGSGKLGKVEVVQFSNMPLKHPACTGPESGFSWPWLEILLLVLDSSDFSDVKTEAKRWSKLSQAPWGTLCQREGLHCNLQV